MMFDYYDSDDYSSNSDDDDSTDFYFSHIGIFNPMELLSVHLRMREILCGHPLSDDSGDESPSKRVKREPKEIPKLTKLGTFFPRDIVKRMFSFIEGHWAAKARTVCKIWCEILDEEGLWKERFENEFQNTKKMHCHWYFFNVRKDQVSRWVSYKRAYQVIFCAKITNRCCNCFQTLDSSPMSLWGMCKDCKSKSITSKEGIKAKYCLDETEIGKLHMLRGTGFFLKEEVDCFLNQNFPDVQQEIASRRKVFTKLNVEIVQQFLNQRTEFYDRLEQKLLDEAPSIPREKVKIISQRFVYDPNGADNEKIQKFINTWQVAYTRYNESLKLFEEHYGKKVTVDTSLPFDEPINASYYISTFASGSLPQNEQSCIQASAQQAAAEQEFRQACTDELNKQTMGKYKAFEDLPPVARRELEETCIRDFRAHYDPIFKKTKDKELTVRVIDTVKVALGYCAKEEILIKEIAKIGFNYRNVVPPKEVADYVKGKSDLTLYQAIMRAIKDYQTPNIEEIIINSLLWNCPREERWKLTRRIFSRLFDLDEKGKHLEDPLLARVKPLKPHRRRKFINSLFRQNINHRVGQVLYSYLHRLLLQRKQLQ